MKKIDASQVEVLDRGGESLTPKKEPGAGAFGVRVIQAGPVGLLLLPLLIPVLILGFFLLMIPMFLFGRRVSWPRK